MSAERERARYARHFSGVGTQNKTRHSTPIEQLAFFSLLSTVLFGEHFCRGSISSRNEEVEGAISKLSSLYITTYVAAMWVNVIKKLDR